MRFGSGNSEGSELGYATVEHQRPALEAELVDCEFEDETLSDRAFRNIDQDGGMIKLFIRGTPDYDKRAKRWRLPTKPKKESELYVPFMKLIRSIIRHYQLSTDHSVLDTYSIRIPHVEGSTHANPAPPGSIPHTNTTSTNIPLLKSSPGICIQAIVKDPTLPNNFPSLGVSMASYRVTVSAIEVKTEKNFNPRSDPIQVAVYARQIFVQQGNRHFVNCFIVTEKHIRLYVFARDGLHFSRKTNIHDHPETFVRFILGASSLKAGVVGFDPTIFWKNGSRFVEAVDCDNQPYTYLLANINPVFYRRAIRGRGTTGWMALDKNKKPVLIKDGWKALGRVPESDLLKHAIGLAGVAQIIGYKDGITTISRLRDIDQNMMEKNALRDREFCRIVLDFYGQSLDRFESRIELLYAYYDALQGYRNLYNSGILHRDISVNNILIGKPGAQSPNRGVIIDLDTAAYRDRVESLRGSDFRIGTRAFQSRNVLESFDPDNNESRPHSYMDDLESFFYVLCWVCCGYSGPHTRAKDFPVHMSQWEHRDALVALKAKLFLYHMSFTRTVKVTDYFGEVFHDLLSLHYHFFQNYYIGRVPPGTDNKPAPTLDQAYTTILSAVEIAIKSVEAQECSRLPKPQLLPSGGRRINACGQVIRQGS